MQRGLCENHCQRNPQLVPWVGEVARQTGAYSRGFPNKALLFDDQILNAVRESGLWEAVTAERAQNVK